jgi:hypothetical protein
MDSKMKISFQPTLSLPMCLLGIGCLILGLTATGCSSHDSTQAPSQATIAQEQQAGQQAAQKAAEQGAAMKAARQNHPQGQ